ncbi:DUF2516 family protein [Flaviflexus salsibiostraticola]|uniref:DUF2516 family protein n=1 Tax=Flaviflexus salsibiostraticola TaxID=1282737 RepID=A0A3Q8WTQ5_9ACTO|nr:DUF2516 family protein [Flaviflexus salsibiostraticola]AZN30064.1 DUF2516 family protein [Flaviflexus salsibiostraticola]
MIGALFNLFVIALFLWAVIDAATRQQAAFDWAGTMSKWKWVGVLLLGLVVRAGLMPFRIPGSFLISLGFFVLVVYYLGSIKPRLDEIPRGGGGNRRGGSW